jgi:hypothetical protein
VLEDGLLGERAGPGIVRRRIGLLSLVGKQVLSERIFVVWGYMSVLSRYISYIPVITGVFGTFETVTTRVV